MFHQGIWYRENVLQRLNASKVCQILTGRCLKNHLRQIRRMRQQHKKSIELLSMTMFLGRMGLTLAKRIRTTKIL